MTQALDDEQPFAALPQPMRHFGGYELLFEIARGGMGVIYQARQTKLNRLVALKMVLGGEFARPEFVRRFRQEAEAAARLQHPNIVAIHDIGDHEGQPYFTMDYVEGPNLAQLVRDGTVSADRAATYLASIADGVHFAHTQGILHRDLKPSNILVDSFGQPRVTDFGLARELHADIDLTLTGQALGSPGYVSPEQASGKREDVGIPSDVYSLGAVFYYLLTGRPPFQAETLPGVLIQVQQAEPVAPRRLNASVPADLETICLKCLEKEPKRRYPNALELAKELRRFLRREPILARPLSAWEKAWRWSGRNRSLSAVLAILTLVLLGGSAAIFSQWRRAEHSAIAERRERERAEASDRRTRLNLYAADMSDASRALDRGDLGLSHRLLEAHRPPVGSEDLRGFEWFYLWERSKGEQRAILHGHKWIVTCVSFSPDGKLLASGGQDSTLNVWDPEKQSLLWSVSAHTGAVWSVSFAPDNRVLASAGSDGEVHIWERDSPKVLTSFPGSQVVLAQTNNLMATAEASPLWWEAEGRISIWDWKNHRKLCDLPEPGKSMAFSSDGKIVAVAHKDQKVSLWNIPSGSLLKTLSTARQVWAPVFSPTGEFLAAAGRGEVVVWNLLQGSKPIVLPHNLTVWSVQFAPDGKTLITADSDRGIRLWDTRNWEVRRILWGHTDEVWCTQVSPDGGMLASGGKDRNVLLWSMATPRRMDPLPHTLWRRPLFSPNGKWIVTSAQTESMQSSVWDLNSTQKLAVMTNGPALGFSPDGGCLVRASTVKPELEWWDITAQKVVKIVPLDISHPSWNLHYTGFSPDWKTGFGISDDGSLLVFEAVSGRTLARIHAPEPPIRSAILSPNARYLALSVERDNAAFLFELPMGKLTKLAGHHDFISGLAFSQDGERLATGSVDATIKLWETKTGRELAHLTGHAEEATDVGFSPDGRTLASIGVHDCVKFWHVETGREMVSLSYPRAGFHLQFSPDGKRLALALAAERNESVQVLNSF